MTAAAPPAAFPLPDDLAAALDAGQPVLFRHPRSGVQFQLSPDPVSTGDAGATSDEPAPGELTYEDYAAAQLHADGGEKLTELGRPAAGGRFERSRFGGGNQTVDDGGGGRSHGGRVPRVEGASRPTPAGAGPAGGRVLKPVVHLRSFERDRQAQFRWRQSTASTDDALIWEDAVSDALADLAASPFPEAYALAQESDRLPAGPYRAKTFGVGKKPTHRIVLPRRRERIAARRPAAPRPRGFDGGRSVMRGRGSGGAGFRPPVGRRVNCGHDRPRRRPARLTSRRSSRG